MNMSTHALAGMTLATRMRHPCVAFGLGILSHAVLDVLPHRDSRNVCWRLLDGSLTLGWLSCARRSSAGELAAIIGAMLPDIENIGEPWRPVFRKKIFPSHHATRHGSQTGRISVALELIVVGAALLVLSRART
jgi:hypothetical protein